MPGVIMENGSRNGSHTNHDRDQRSNGTNGAGYAGDKAPDKGKGRAEPQQNMTPISPSIPNGVNGVFPGNPPIESSQNPPDMQERIPQLPPEIAHITHGYMDLKMLISRLTQKTYSDLINTIKELAQMPQPPTMVNGNADSVGDTSSETVNKKLRLLKFATDSHEAWTKALVITGWSRNAEDVSKIIDLKIFLDEQGRHYSNCIDTLAFDRKSLKDARLPNPDLRTALEVLGTGKASWMPDLGYIKSAPLTAQEVLKAFEKLNTLLSLRLNLNDYDKIPFHFKDFNIKDGRVTFKVAGEFEVDLTITDEDPEAQYWFIDIRFQFQPSLDILTPQVRYFIDQKMNDVLREEGLAGCYKVLHEMVLTYKINEFRRQAIVLSTSTWIPTLKVELLHRAVSIQYWADRFDRIPKGSAKPRKSWLLMGVHSGKRKDRQAHPKDTSRLFIRWFRDAKEVKDAEILFDDVQICTESLLRMIISKHIAYILTTIYDNLKARPLYQNRDLDLSLSISEIEGAQSELNVQLTSKHRLSIKIEPVTGRFIFGPAERRTLEFGNWINANVSDPEKSAHESIEKLRYNLIIDGMSTNGPTVGWDRMRNPGVKNDQMQVWIKDAAQIHWFRRSGWVDDWYLVLALNMSGERWYLVQTAITATPTDPNLMILAKRIMMPIKAVSPIASYGFLTSLSIFAAAMISYHENIKTLWARKDLHLLTAERRIPNMTMPAINIKLSDLLPSQLKLKQTGKPWAKNVVRLTFRGIELERKAKDQADSTETTSVAVIPGNRVQQEKVVMITEARMLAPLPAGVTKTNGKFDSDIAFNSSSGSFAFRLRSKVGEPIIEPLIRRLVSVERLVDFVAVMKRHEGALKCETISLDNIVFTYVHNVRDTNGALKNEETKYTATVDFSAKQSRMSLILQKDNPHILILDYLQNILNSARGLDGVADLLPVTLPVLCGLDAMELSWGGCLSGYGTVFVNVRAADWYIIRYEIKDPPPSQEIQRVHFDIRMRHRRGVAWWHVRRDESEAGKREKDGLDDLLAVLWSENGDGWQGMRVSGVATAAGVFELIGKMDRVVSTFAMSKTSKDVAPDQQRPSAPVQQKKLHLATSGQRLQQPTPNPSQQSHSQASAQGRNHNSLKRSFEVVEID